jgi:hypothetical protein
MIPNDSATNPLLLIKASEEREAKRVAYEKDNIETHEKEQMDRLAAFEKEADATARTEGQAALRAFAQVEPPAILKKGAESAEKEIVTLKQYAATKKNVVVDTLVAELLSPSI